MREHIEFHFWICWKYLKREMHTLSHSASIFQYSFEHQWQQHLRSTLLNVYTIYFLTPVSYTITHLTKTILIAQVECTVDLIFETSSSLAIYESLTWNIQLIIKLVN